VTHTSQARRRGSCDDRSGRRDLGAHQPRRETKVFELLPGGEIEERLTGPGFMFDIVKIR
jgi:hypothetical protein